MTYINVLEHEMVPKHELLDESEVKAVLQKYAIKKEEMPKIRVDDPAAQAVGAQVGDVLRITRKSPTAGTFVSYRLVVE
ncbi:MAG: DNA-directed RNA polymerase subunit H [Methermicoccaceae archaeon]